MIQPIVKKIKLSERPSDREYWMSKTPDERLEALEILRQQYLEMNPHAPKRVVRVITKRKLHS
ncbi:hypothetical protein K1X84_12245 [bacterium]|nr:hypothetical protein [bacterium]